MVHPLLPVLFFEAGSAEFPDRYRIHRRPAISSGYTDTSAVVLGLREARLDAFDQVRAQKYYEILDVVGYRLRQSSEAVLRIEGGYSNEPVESADLATLRAETVRDYLLMNWGIGPERLVLLPPRRYCDSTASWIEQEESRRVTLLCDDPGILREVRFRVLSANTGMLYLNFVLDPRFASAAIRTIELSVSLGDMVLCRSTIPVSADSTEYHLRGVVPIFWALNDVIVPSDPVLAQAVVVLHDGRRFLSNQSRLDFEEHLSGPYRGHDWEVGVATNQSTPIRYLLPYFNWHDTTVNAHQVPALTELLHKLDSAMGARSKVHALERAGDAGALLRPRIAINADAFEEILRIPWSSSGKRLRLIDRARDSQMTALSSAIDSRMLDRSNPPQLIFLADSASFTGAVAEWMGYDVRGRRVEIDSNWNTQFNDEVLAAEKDTATEVVSMTSKDIRALRERIERGRIRALADILEEARSSGSVPYEYSIDTLGRGDPFARYEEAFDAWLLPEGRLARRYVSVVVYYDGSKGVTPYER